MDTSSASSSFSFSDVDVSDVSSVKQKKRSQYRYLKRGLSLVTKKYKPSIRKISKEDVKKRRREFAKWLISEENIKPDNLAEKHRDALFKKFVKKWNGNKLPKNYYIEADSLWVSASPQIEPKLPAAPCCTDHKQPRRTMAKVGDSWCQLAVSTPTDSPASISRPSFGTFGKKAGATALRELQAESILSRPDCTEAVNRHSAADGGENITVCASAYGEQIAVFDRGDAKRAGVRRALTICRTAL